MRQFYSFVQKEFYHIFRDTRTMMILIIMPIVQIILFGFAIRTEVETVRFAVFDSSQDRTTDALIHQISDNPYFDFKYMIHSPGEIDALFRKNKIDMVLVFEPAFEKNLLHQGQAAVQVITDGSDPNTALTISNYVNTILSDEQQQLMTSPPPFQVIPNIKLLFNPQRKSAYNFVPGVMGLILMLICAMMTSISIVREKERGTMEVLLVSPVKPIQIIIAKVIPYLVISVINLITILLLSVFVLKVPILGNLFWLSVISLVFIITALSLGILISSITTQQATAMVISGIVLMMPTMLLSGMIFPIESMPRFLQWLSCIIPARWYIAAVKKIMIEGLSIDYALKELLILCGMSLVLVIISLKKFKNRLE